jgi:hypothetical protein
LPAATPAQKAFQKWGWRKLARASDHYPGSPVFDVLFTTLPATRELWPEELQGQKSTPDYP